MSIISVLVDSSSRDSVRLFILKKGGIVQQISIVATNFGDFPKLYNYGIKVIKIVITVTIIPKII